MSDTLGKLAYLGLNKTNENIEVMNATKTDKSYVDQQISSVGDGSPKGVYATLADLTAAYPSGAAGTYLVEADGFWYYWNGTIWKDGNVYQATGIGNGSVTNVKLGEDVIKLKSGKNLYNKEVDILGFFVQASNGVLAGNAVYNATEFIEVDPDSNYYRSYVHQLAFYDSGKQYISGLSSGATFTTPSNAKYVRLTISVDAEDVFLYKDGEFGDIYIPFGYEIDERAGVVQIIPSNYTITSDKIKRDAITAEKIAAKNIDVEHLSFLAPSKNLFNFATVNEDGYINTAGNISFNVDYVASDYISITEGLPYTVTQNRYLAFYDSNYDWLNTVEGDGSDGSSEATNVTLIAPPTAAYMRVSVKRVWGSSDWANWFQVEQDDESTYYVPYGHVLRTHGTFQIIGDVDNNVISTPKVQDKAITTAKTDFFEHSKNLYNPDNAEDNFYVSGNSGALSVTTSYNASEFIPIIAGEDYSISYNRMLAFYNSEKIYVSGIIGNGEVGVNSVTNFTFTAPNNAAYIRISVRTTDDILMFNIGSEMLEYEEYGSILKPEYLKNVPTISDVSNLVDQIVLKGATARMIKSAILSDGETIALPMNNIKKNNQISFYGFMDSFTGLFVGHGKGEYNGNHIEIDNTNLKTYADEVLYNTIPHGLTITNFIGVILDLDNTGHIKIIINTVSGKFEYVQNNWNGNQGQPFAESIGTSFTDVQLTFDCDDYKKNIYAYGDSYFSTTSSARWPKVMLDMGYDNCLLDNYSGRGSSAAYTAFLDTMSVGNPAFILWCLGMNDPDSDTAINATWQNVIEDIMTYCDDHNIEVVLSTTPSCPGRNHSFKNAYVKASGRRYVDFEKAVGAHDSVNWYTDMLYTDLVHPTADGARALCFKALCDMPELMEEY